jgi:hypothetical protein
MGLILRVDVDKPYGHSSLLRKIASKVAEDYFPIPFFGGIQYLKHLEAFLECCNSEQVPGFIYHRQCTVPDKKINELLIAGGHKLGFHAENTRSEETFAAELRLFSEKVSPAKVSSFTKHGSGVLKLGKHHYPPYEPEKYKAWSARLGIGFYFGNGICANAADLYAADRFYPTMFWIEKDYRNPAFSELQQLLDAARSGDVAILIHPENFYTYKSVAHDFRQLIKLAREEGIGWKVF